jgi:Leucine-rich repeat (LRR) protein
LITWKDIELLAPSIPLLEDLQLGGNQLSQLGSNLDLQYLKWLNLEDNLINDWTEVAKLGSLKK